MYTLHTFSYIGTWITAATVLSKFDVEYFELVSVLMRTLLLVLPKGQIGNRSAWF